MLLILFVLFFFKQKTAYEMRISDWSSDVCSSDLPTVERGKGVDRHHRCLLAYCRRGLGIGGRAGVAQGKDIGVARMEQLRFAHLYETGRGRQGTGEHETGRVLRRVDMDHGEPLCDAREGLHVILDRESDGSGKSGTQQVELRSRCTL